MTAKLLISRKIIINLTMIKNYRVKYINDRKF